MTRRQANLISYMIRSQTISSFHDARRELLESCEEQKSDAAALQPSVTVTATSSQSEPVQPSTPQPTGFDYKKSLLEGEKSTTLRMYMDAVEKSNKLQAEVKSFKEVIGSQDGKIASLKESVENRTKTIEMLKNQIELLTKRIKDDREHWDGCREHNNELVAANAEIYQSLRHWGLEQSEPCSLVNNVKHVIQLCAERGKKIEELNGNVKALQFNINVINESNISDQGDLRKRIAELEKHAASRQVIIDQLNADLASANTDIGNQDRELADHDAKYQRLQQVCDDLRRRRAEGSEESQKLLKKIADLEKVIDVLSKQQPSGDRGTLRAIISQLKSENELLCERIKHRLNESKTLSASIHKSRERIEELMETVNGHADVVAEKNRSIESLNADCSRLALEIKQKDKVISALNDRITLSGEAMTMLGVDNKKLNEALETLSSVNQKIADNVAKLRYEKDSDEAGYIKKLTDKSLRIAVLKKAGNDLCACLKRYHYSDTQQPHVVSALRNWEKEAR